jgi:hypothetical protein
MGKQCQTRPLGLQKFMTNLDSVEALLIFWQTGQIVGVRFIHLLLEVMGRLEMGKQWQTRPLPLKSLGNLDSAETLPVFFMDVSNSNNFICSLPTPSDHCHRLAQVAASERVRDDNNVDERYPSPNNTCPTAESNDICPPAKPASDNDNGVAQGAAYVRARADNNADKHNPTANDTRPPAVKSGFRGKPATKKIGVYGKRGGKQKANPLGHQDPLLVTIWNPPLISNHVVVSLLAGRSPRC